MKKNIQTAYGDPTPAFHHKVMNTLYHLDDTVPAKTKRFNAKKIAVFAIVAAVIGTTTVVAAATNMFGLIQEPVGKYGVSVTAGMNASEEEEYPQYNNDYDIVMSYLPEGYLFAGSHGGFSIVSENYPKGFYLFGHAYDADTYHQTEGSVIKTEEKTFNGHQTIINHKKASEEIDKIYYVATVKFDEENIVVRLENYRFKDEISYDELIKILEGLSVVPASEKEPEITPVENKTPIKTPISDYSPFDEKPSATVPVGTAYETVVAGNDGVEKKISIKVSSVVEQDNAVGLNRDDFDNAGPTYNLHDYFFDSNDQLKDSYTETVYDSVGDGINSLSHTHERTFQNHFYVASVEITAQQDIDDIYSVLTIDASGIDENGDFFYESDEGRITCLYLSDRMSQPQVPVKAGETVTLKAGILANDDLIQKTVLEITTVDDCTEKATKILVPLN